MTKQINDVSKVNIGFSNILQTLSVGQVDFMQTQEVAQNVQMNVCLFLICNCFTIPATYILDKKYNHQPFAIITSRSLLLGIAA